MIVHLSLAVSTATTYYAMKRRNREWKGIHRTLTMVLLIAAIVHIMIDLTIA